MKHNRSLLSARLFLSVAMVFCASCGGEADKNNDAGGDDCPTPGESSPTPACSNPGISAPVCRAPTAAVVTDLSGTWVLQLTGAQVVQASGFTQPFHLKSITTALVQVTQTGNAVSLDGTYCNRAQQDDPNNPAQVSVMESWRLTPSPLQRTGTYAPDSAGQWTLSLPALVETFGARLANPACDSLPLDANDPRLVDDDNDGSPGISVGLKGLVNATMRAVQRQVTAMTGVALSAERVEGGMVYSSDQTVVASVPASIRCIYRTSKAYTDPAECSSSFVMIKVNPSAGAVDCAWVRNNQAAMGL